MGNKLEQLLNSLIKKGWKPFKWKNIKKVTNEGWFCSFIRNSKKGFGGMSEISHRELVSKESGLWQFVCENGMIKEEHKHERILDPTFGEGWADCKRQEHDGNYGYRLIESALCDEDKLEDFLLSNIKIGNED